MGRTEPKYPFKFGDTFEVGHTPLGLYIWGTIGVIFGFGYMVEEVIVVRLGRIWSIEVSSVNTLF